MFPLNLRSLLALYRARLRSRSVLVQEGFAVVGIAVGVALLFASQIASSSLTHAFNQLDHELLGGEYRLQMEARGPEGFDQRLLGEVQRLPGVRLTLPLLEAQARVVGPSGGEPVELIGTDPRLADAGGRLLRRYSAKQLASQQAVALPTPLADRIGVGRLEVFNIQVGASAVPTLLGETLGESDIPGVSDSPVAVTNIAYAQRLAGLPGRLTRIFVKPAAGREAMVRSELGALAPPAQANVEPADYDATLFSFASSTNRQAEGLFSGICALVAFMFAINAMLITAPARRRLLEDIRPQGATRLMAAQVVVFDALVLGGLGCAVGIGAGDLLSIAAGSAPPDYLTFAFPVGASRIVTWQSVAVAVAAGLAATLIGVLWPLRAQLSGRFESDASAVRSGRSRGVVTVAGVLLLAATTSIFLWRTQSVILASVMLIAALVCLLPNGFDALVWAFAVVQQRVGRASTALAATELRTPRTRTRSLAIAATAAVAVCGITELGGAQSNLEHGVIATVGGLNSHADVWVLPEGRANILVTKPFEPAPQTLAHISGVASVGLFRSGLLNWGKRRLWVQAPPASLAQLILPVQLRAGSLALADARLRAGGWAVLSEGLASEHHLQIGDAFTLPSPRPTVLRVAGLATNLGWTAGAMLMSSEQYERAWGSDAVSAYLIKDRPGASATAVRDAVGRALGPDSGLRAQTQAQRIHGDEASFRAGLSRLTEIRLLLAVAAIMAVAGALGAIIWQRRELVALIRCDGYPRGVVWRWLVAEIAVLIAAGSAIGAAFGVYGVRLATSALVTVTGYPVVYGLGLLVALTSMALVSVVVVAIVALPGYLVARTPPGTAGPRY